MAISHATLICFNVSQIKKCFAQKLAEGMLSFQVADASDSGLDPMVAKTL